MYNKTPLTVIITGVCCKQGAGRGGAAKASATFVAERLTNYSSPFGGETDRGRVWTTRGIRTT